MSFLFFFFLKDNTFFFFLIFCLFRLHQSIIVLVAPVFLLFIYKKVILCVGGTESAGFTF